MSNEVIKYHNDLNSIRLPSGTEMEQKILLSIVGKVKNRKSGELIEFTYDELKEFCGKNFTRKEMFEVVRILKEKFFKADTSTFIETTNEIIFRTTNLFKNFSLHAVKDNPNDGYNRTTNLTRITMSIIPEAEYIFNNFLGGNYTEYEVAEFQSISGRYALTLYRLLKQFRSTGKLLKYKAKWDEFCEIMDFPKNLKMKDIDGYLKKAINELTKERNLFDQNRKPFKNLKYEKIKGKGRGRGGNVIGIIFTFKPEILDAEVAKDEKIAELEKKLEIEQRENAALITEFGVGQKFGQYRGRHYVNSNGETLKIIDVWEVFGKIQVKFKNTENETFFITDDFESEKHLDNYLAKFTQI